MSNITIKAELGSPDSKIEKTPKVSGLAYSGGKLELGWDLPVVVDLAGLQIPEEIPLLADHDNSTSSRVGVIAAEVLENQLFVRGEILSKTADAQDIVLQGKKSCWQMSIGAETIEVQKIEAGIMTINGREQEAPFYFVSKAILREVSIVAVGADINSKMTIEAQAKTIIKGVENMDEDKEKAVSETEETAVNQTEEPAPEETIEDVKTALEQERKRIADIKKIIDGEDAELEDEAIQAGWTADLTASKMLTKIRANRPSVNIITKGNNMDTPKMIEAALSLRAGIDEKEILKSVGEENLEAGYKNRNMSLQDCMRESLKAEGKVVTGAMDTRMIKAALATSLPGTLSNVANKRLSKAFKAVDPAALKFASIADLKDFKASEIYSISTATGLAEVVDTGDTRAQLTSDNMAEVKGTNQLKTYGKIITLTRKDIINDDLGAFLKMFDYLGLQCGKQIDKLFFAKLLTNDNFTDTKAMFHADHSNIAEGTDTALSVDSVKLAISKFLKQTGVDGAPIGAMPKYLVVPPELLFLAREICNSQYVIGGSSKVPAMNSVAGLLEAIASPWLSNSNVTGYSSTAWYLFADPMEVGSMEIGFLNGNQMPTIEQGEPDFDTLATAFRCYYDIGIGVADYRGMLKNTGVAAVEG